MRGRVEAARRGLKRIKPEHRVEPELREILEEAGFAGSEVYVEGWDEESDDTDGIFRRRKRFENQAGWVAYVVGYSS